MCWGRGSGKLLVGPFLGGGSGLADWVPGELAYRVLLAVGWVRLQAWQAA